MQEHQHKRTGKELDDKKKKKVKENQMTSEEATNKLNMFFEKNVATNPGKWSYYKSQAKKKFDVYPSAYANGWAAKQYKAAGGGWKKESVDEGGKGSGMSKSEKQRQKADDYAQDTYKKKKPKKFKKDYPSHLADMGESVDEGMTKQQADVTLKQLGANKFIAMTGAKQFSFGKQGLGFRIGKNSKSINYVRVDLKSNDLYDMEFIRIRGSKIKVVKKVTGVYNDQLQKIFTKHTGLYTSL